MRRGPRRCFDAMNFRFLFDPKRQLFSIGYRLRGCGRTPAGSMRPTTICSPPKRAWPASSPSPRATCRRCTGSTSDGRSRASAEHRCCSRGARTLFEYLMPLLVMRTLPEHAARRVLPAGRPPADGLRSRMRRALGHLGVRLQPRRSPRHLSVQGVRHPGARPEARAGRRAGRRAVRHCARRHDRARREQRPTCAGSRPRASKASTGSSTPSTTRSEGPTQPSRRPADDRHGRRARTSPTTRA